MLKARENTMIRVQKMRDRKVRGKVRESSRNNIFGSPKGLLEFWVLSSKQ